LVNFIHVTDLHLSHPEANDENLNINTERMLLKFIEIISLLKFQPDFLVISGDLANHGALRSYKFLKECLSAFSWPVIMALGNHDNRENFYHVFNNQSSSSPYYHDNLYAGLHVITLDTSVPGLVSGKICSEQFGYLDHVLEKNENIPKLLVLHHPPQIDTDGLSWSSLDIESTRKLQTALKGKKIIGILAGHIHINRFSLWDGIPVCISNGLHSYIDILETNHLRILNGSSFSICTLRPSGLSVSYVPLTPKQNELGIVDQERLKEFT